ncbi:MAG: DNA topoisomerase IB [Alphaproteobacteria bacterium]|nr:DNA topoisomerase IB [Alphaproteobacteria bacterium]
MPRDNLLEVAALDPIAAARAAHLRHVGDDAPGITRHKARHGFDYRDTDGQLIADTDTLGRIKSLAIPPAWTNVWICPQANGHIQATGRDARGRKQYRYHPRWRQTRDETKYGRMLMFARALPRIRARVAADLRRRGLPRDKVLAAIVRLLELTLFRIGNAEYSRTNKSFGLTTLRDRHAVIEGDEVRLSFRGKHGIRHEGRLTDPRLARIVKNCRDLPGYELFQYLDSDGSRHAVDSADVNDYLRVASGEDITAKDFRTWAGTQLAALALRELAGVEDEVKKSAIVRAVEHVAKHLGNTAAVCRKCYIHPAIFDGYLDGTLLKTLAARTRAYLARNVAGMSAEEAAVAAFLRLRLERLAKTRPLARGTASDGDASRGATRDASPNGANPSPIRPTGSKGSRNTDSPNRGSRNRQAAAPNKDTDRAAPTARPRLGQRERRAPGQRPAD